MITIEQATEWSIASTYWTQFVSWEWAQKLCGKYFAWKVRFRYAVYKAHYERKARLKALAQDGCPPDCGHTDAEHAAFDAGLKAGEEGKHESANPHDDESLWWAWITGHSVGTLNRKYRKAR